MSQTEIAFWSTVAQISVVLALAMTFEYARLYNGQSRDSGWRSYKLGATGGIIFGFVSIGLAMFTAVNALSFGRSSPGQASQAISGLIAGFVVCVGWPASLLLLRIWFAPRNPKNPEPPSLGKSVWDRLRRKEPKTTEAESAAEDGEGAG